MAFADAHNFGLKTTLQDGWIHKFRPVFWEWIFLCDESPLRAFTRSLFKEEDPLAAFATLKFKTPFDSCSYFQRHIIQKLELSPIKNVTEKEAFQIGASFGSSAFFGLTDLHLENFHIGKLSNGKFIATPVDIEIAFEQIESLCHTHLISSNRVEKSLVSIFQGIKIDKTLISSLIEGFLHSFELLESIADELHLLLKNLAVNKVPIRLVVSPTKKYYSFLDNQINSSSFYTEEVTQLDRGDIPYFWTFLDSPRAFYFNQPNIYRSTEDIKINNLLSNERFSLSNILKNREQLKKIAIFQLARAIDPKDAASISSSSHIHVIYFRDLIFIKTPKQDIKCKRSSNLSSFHFSPLDLLSRGRK